MSWFRAFFLFAILVQVASLSGCGPKELPNASEEELKKIQEEMKANVAAEDAQQKANAKAKKK